MKRNRREQNQRLYAAGIVAATLININRKKGARAVDPSEFVPGMTKGGPQTPDALRSKVEKLNALFGGRDLRKKG